jgi:putative endonuclease
MTGGWVYIMTNKPNGILYVGMTSDIARRAWEHREGVADGFTKRYGLKRLVYVEAHDEITAAIQREKLMKHWSRSWKVQLILRSNPDWKTSTINWCSSVDGRVKPGHDVKGLVLTVMAGLDPAIYGARRSTNDAVP